MRIALYPGSFDPITMGHLDIIKRVYKLFDHIVVGVLHNPKKNTLFTPKERTDIITNVLKAEKLDNCVSVDSFHGLLVDYTKAKNINVVIRGLRATSDYEYEHTLALMNKELSSELETFFLMASNNYSFVSSNLIKELFPFGADLKNYVHPIVMEAMKKQLS